MVYYQQSKVSAREFKLCACPSHERISIRLQRELGGITQDRQLGCGAGRRKSINMGSIIMIGTGGWHHHALLLN
jgi:hypothetical protein